MFSKQFVAVFYLLSLATSTERGVFEIQVYNGFPYNDIEVIGITHYCTMCAGKSGLDLCHRNVIKPRKTKTLNQTTYGAPGAEGYVTFDGYLWINLGKKGCDQENVDHVNIFKINLLENGKSIMGCLMRYVVFEKLYDRHCEVTSCAGIDPGNKISLYADSVINTCGEGGNKSLNHDFIYIRVARNK